MLPKGVPCPFPIFSCLCLTFNDSGCREPNPAARNDSIRDYSQITINPGGRIDVSAPMLKSALLLVGYAALGGRRNQLLVFPERPFLELRLGRLPVFSTCAQLRRLDFQSDSVLFGIDRNP